MRILIDEYGKIILYIIVGTVILGSVIGGVRIWYQSYYPSLWQGSSIDVVLVEQSPVLLVDNIEISADDSASVDFSTYANAYVEGKPDEELLVEVYGTEQIEEMSKGLYQLVYAVTSNNGDVFTKQVSVLVY